LSSHSNFLATKTKTQCLRWKHACIFLLMYFMLGSFCIIVYVEGRKTLSYDWTISSWFCLRPATCRKYYFLHCWILLLVYFWKERWQCLSQTFTYRLWFCLISFYVWGGDYLEYRYAVN
jgi:hypothetical protein